MSSSRAKVLKKASVAATILRMLQCTFRLLFTRITDHLKEQILTTSQLEVY